MIDVRKEYKRLNEEQLAQVNKIKSYAETLSVLLQDATREMAIARTKLEECVMWATKSLTK